MQSAPTRSAQPAIDDPDGAASAPVEALEAGDTVPAEDASEINASWGGPMDDKAYQMPDGAYVLIKGGQPLPENVRQQVTSSMTSKSSALHNSSEYDVSASSALREERLAQEAATGRKTTYVTHAMNALPDGTRAARWTTDATISGSGSYDGTSREEAIALAMEWVNKSPETREVIVLNTIG